MQPKLIPCDVDTDLVFLEYDPKHATEKPYKLQYDPGENLPRWNCKNRTQSGVRLHDMRGREKEFTVQKQGFEVLRLPSKLSPEDFYNENKVKKVYHQEMRETLKEAYGAKRVEILEHGIRKRHPEFPVSTGEDYDYLQPTSVVHIDFTLDAALESSEHALKVNRSDYQRVQCINIWKPLRGPLTDWPLAVCDVQTVNMERDCMATDVVTREGFTENFQIYHNEEHRWYYLNNQLADEIVVFRQTDTDERYAIGVPHAGFRNPAADPSERPRESVEARAFLYY